MQSNATKLERRVWPLGQIETRVAADGRAMITGYAAVFDQLSVVIWDMFRERIERGAFAKSIAEDDVRALWNHNADFPLARRKNGTLDLNEDGHGLAFALTPPATQLAADFVETVRQGYVDAMSFGFSVLDDSWDEDADGQLIRTLQKIKLYEISPVTFPAYPQTEAQVRAALSGGGFGDKPDIPAQLGRAAAGDLPASALDDARARLVVRRRNIEIARMGP